MMTMDTTTSSSGTSYAINCAAPLIPPMTVYLLLEDQPPIRMAKGARLKTANPSRRASGTLTAYQNSLQGIRPRSITEVARIITTAYVYSFLSESLGMMISLSKVLMPSAKFWNPPSHPT